MAIEISSGGVSKTYRYYPRDAFYVDAGGNVNTSGQGQQVREAYFNGVKYYPEEIPNIQYICWSQYSSVENLDPTITYYPYVTKCVVSVIKWMNDVTRSHAGGSSIPTMLELPACTTIEMQAFAGVSRLESIDIPNCASIGNRAFESCTSLKNVGTTGTLKNLAAVAFSGCSSLETIDISGCTSIGSSTFENCEALSSIDLSAVGKINSRAFYNSGLVSVDSPATEVGSSCFTNCKSLTSVNLPNCSALGGSAFMNCVALARVNIPLVTAIGANTFASCQALTSISLPLCTSVGSYALSDCPLTNVNIPLCETVGVEAFRWDTELTSVSFPRCTHVYEKAFADCTSLTDVTVADGCQFDRDVFYHVYPRPQVHYA
jgi:hypothetical protein